MERIPTQDGNVWFEVDHSLPITYIELNAYGQSTTIEMTKDQLSILIFVLNYAKSRME